MNIVQAYEYKLSSQDSVGKDGGEFPAELEQKVDLLIERINQLGPEPDFAKSFLDSIDLLQKIRAEGLSWIGEQESFSFKDYELDLKEKIFSLENQCFRRSLSHSYADALKGYLIVASPFIQLLETLNTISAIESAIEFVRSEEVNLSLNLFHLVDHPFFGPIVALFNESLKFEYFLLIAEMGVRDNISVYNKGFEKDLIWNFREATISFLVSVSPLVTSLDLDLLPLSLQDPIRILLGAKRAEAGEVEELDDDFLTELLSA